MIEPGLKATRLPPARLPAEWEPQSGVLISWPVASSDWQHNLADAESTYIELAVLISGISQLYICCNDSRTRMHVQQCCENAGINPARLDLFTLPYNDTWTRDYGPVSLLRGNGVVWLDFKFNAWGEKYPHWHDNRLTALLQQQFKPDRQIEQFDFVLEGGSIDSDGAGTVLTTSSCLLNPARNPGMDRQQIEKQLIKSLAIRRVLWLDYGLLEGDDTDAHIDTLARFCSPDTITYVQCTDPSDSQYESLQAMQQQLQSFSQLNDQPYNLIPLPLPTACFNRQGQRLPASYANFLILNGHLLAPVYGLETDQLALLQLNKAFPSHEITPVQCRPLLEQFGSLHCITMQLP